VTQKDELGRSYFNTFAYYNSNMAQKDVADLKQFLKPFPKEVAERALWLRQFVWKLYPDANELIYDNYNAVAFGWSVTEKLGHTFCSIAVGRTSHNVHFGFYYGAKISDPDNILLGNGNQYRYILVTDVKEFPSKYITKLLKEAYNYSLALVKDKSQITHGTTTTKSISAKKRKEGKG
jgi:Domain of unknown function (DU1801)